SQNADRQAFLAGRAPDWDRKQQWLDVLADDARNGLVSQRVRVFSARLNDDELTTCHYGYPFTGRYEDVRMLRAGEHPQVQQLECDHDDWVIQPVGGPVSVLRMHYTAGGAFEGASVVSPGDQVPYLSEKQIAWKYAEPFAQWWARHPELHRSLAA